MPFYNNFTSIIDSHFKCIGSVYSFAELCESKVRDIQEWMTSTTSNKLALTIPLSDNESRVCLVDCLDYQDALDNAQGTYTCYVNESQTINLTADQITDAVDNSIIELQAQKNFIVQMLQAGEVKLSEVTTNLKTMVVGITANKLEWFANIVSGCSSPVEAIANFFSSFKLDTPIIESTYVGYTWNTSYKGNAYEAAAVQISEDVSNFLSVVGDALQHLEKFGEIMCEGLLKFGRVLFGSAFGNLMTIYEKGSNAVSGYLNYPIFGFYTHDDANFESVVRRMFASGLNSYSWNHENFQLNPTTLQGSLSSIAASFRRLFKDTVNGVSYDSVTQVIVPISNSPFDMMIQIGKESADKDIILIQGFLVCNYSTFSKYEDADIPELIFDTLKEFIITVNTIAPWSLSKQHVDDTSVHWQELTERFWKYGSYGNELFDYQNFGKRICSINATDEIACIVRSLLIYACVMSKGFVNTSGNDITNDILMYLYNSNSSFYNIDVGDEGIINELSPISNDVFLSKFSSETFRPYNKHYFLSPTVIYQTTSQRAQELTSLFYKILIATALVVVTIKVIKFRKSRQFTEYTAWAQADSLSWAYAENPTEANRQNLLKAFRKAKKVSFTNSLLGFTSEYAFSAASSTLLSSQIASDLSGLHSKGTSDTTLLNTKIGQVKTLITGEN